MQEETRFPKFPMHFRGLLLLAGMYTLAWSAIYAWLGPSLLTWMGMGNYQGGEFYTPYFGVFGIGVGLVLFFSAFYPVSWVWLILIGISGKLLTAVWFILGCVPEVGWNKRSIFHLVFNELVWLIPLIIIFLRSLQVKNYLNQSEH